MEWEKEAEEYIQQLKPVNITTVLKQKVFSLIDLTSLNDTDTTASIAAFSEKSISPLGHVAAICVYPQFVRLIAAAFSETPIKVATVANFPHGKDSLESVMVQIGDALENGAQEMDVVFPYERFLAGEHQYAELFITTCKAACGDDVLLKVILETGALPDLKTIAEASRIALFGGADFIKTSTGKIAQGATLEAVAVMLLVIKTMHLEMTRIMGVKVSGGIRDIDVALQYIQLTDLIMGQTFVDPHTFRIGTSQLADKLVSS